MQQDFIWTCHILTFQDTAGPTQGKISLHLNLLSIYTVDKILLEEIDISAVRNHLKE